MKDITEDQEEAAFDPKAVGKQKEATAREEIKNSLTTADIFSHSPSAEPQPRKDSKLAA